MMNINNIRVYNSNGVYPGKRLTISEKKKRLYLRYIFLLLLLFCVKINAQELSIKSFQEVATDLTARTAPRKDVNGMDCALIKVRVASDNAIFRGAIAGDVKCEMGEYLVYMSPGAKSLIVLVPNFLPLDIRFQDHVDAIVSKTTYVLTLVKETKQEAVTKSDGDMEYFSLSVSPYNAVVWIDGQLQTVDDNGSLIALLKAGKHRYRIEANGYEPVEGSFDLSKGKVEKIEKLKSEMAHLHISCPTDSSVITVNGVIKGYGKWYGHLPEGTYIVEVSKPSYGKHTDRVTLSKDETQSLEFPFLPMMVGAIDVTSDLEQAEVFMDGEKRGVTPCTIKDVRVGKHTVTLAKSGHRTLTFDVDVTDERMTRVDGVFNNGPIADITYNTSENEKVVDTNGDNKIYDFVDVQPKFVADDDVRQWITQHIVYPAEAKKNHIRGKVVVEFVINKDGSVSDAKLVQSVDPHLDAEALRVISSMPKWIPAKKNGKVVRTKAIIPVKFEN